MKKTTIVIAILLVGLFSTAQKTLENPGFESWEEIGFGPDIIEPVNWSTIKSSDNIPINGVAPVVCERSTDSHSGNYSVKLTNKSTLGIVATGTTSNGRFHAELDPNASFVYTSTDDPRWNSSLTARPDSVIGWYKAEPTGSDFPTIKFLLHKGEASIPGDETNYIGLAYLELPAATVTDWTRFSTPFVYSSSEMPEYILSILTSGDGVNSVGGGIAYFDDFQLVYNSSSINEYTVKKLHVYQRNNTIVLNLPPNELGELDIAVYNINGQTLSRITMAANSDKLIDISSFDSGLLTVTAISETNTYVGKVMVVK